MERVKILIIDDDEASQSALRHVLDTEGWQVTVVPLAREGMARLAGGDWKLLIVNVALADVQGPMFEMLKELTQAAPVPGKPRVAVLFVVPELLAPIARPVLEAEQLPFVLKPFHLHDFLERVSDLLLETHCISEPIRQVKQSPAGERRKAKERREGFDRRTSSMFASRKDYFMSDEEIAEWEKQEAEERKKREEGPGNKDLGSGKR